MLKLESSFFLNCLAPGARLRAVRAWRCGGRAQGLPGRAPAAAAALGGARPPERTLPCMQALHAMLLSSRCDLVESVRLLLMQQYLVEQGMAISGMHVLACRLLKPMIQQGPRHRQPAAAAEGAARAHRPCSTWATCSGTAGGLRRRWPATREWWRCRRGTGARCSASRSR